MHEIPLESDPVREPARLQALQRSGLLETKRGEGEFDRVTELAARVLGVPVCLVSLVDSDCQVFIGACGLPAPYDRERSTPLSHSFCQHAVRSRRPLIIEDARQDPRVAGNGAITDLGVIAYLGFPIVGSDHEVYGAFCVIDGSPRKWTKAEIRKVREFTGMVADIIDLKSGLEQFRTHLDVVIHDLKNPFTGVTMVADMLKDRVDDLPADLRPLVEALSDAADRGMGLLENVSKIDRIDETPCGNLCERIGELVDRHRPQAHEKGLKVDFEPAARERMLAVAGWAVSQIVENLLSNALKFTPSGGTVRITVEDIEGGIEIEVADDGPGFSDDDRVRLFQRYARLSAEPTAGEESTGLGLSIVKKLVDQAGGRIRLLSGPGEGARFRLSLPEA